MNMEKGDIRMNIMMASSLVLPARKYLCFFVSTSIEKSKLGIKLLIVIIIIIIIIIIS